MVQVIPFMFYDHFCGELLQIARMIKKPSFIASCDTHHCNPKTPPLTLQKKKQMDLKSIIAQKEPIIVDVRETFEFSMGHVDGAINIPLGLIPLRLEELRKMEKPLFLYCRSGGRSGQASAFLKSKGIKEVYNAGGLEDALQLFQQVSF